MDCPEIRDAFVKGELPNGTAVEAHLRGCRQCSELFLHEAELGRSLAVVAGGGMPFEDDLFAKLEADVAQETGLRAWLRSRPTRLRFVAAVLSVLLVVGLGGALHQRPDFAEYPLARLVLLLSVYAAGILIAFGKELYLSARRGALSDHVGLFVGALALPFLIAFAPATEASRHAGPEEPARGFAQKQRDALQDDVGRQRGEHGRQPHDLHQCHVREPHGERQDAAGSAPPHQPCQPNPAGGEQSKRGRQRGDDDHARLQDEERERAEHGLVASF